MRILKANTAVRLVVGPLCDKTTGLAKTGMTVTNMAMNMWHEHDDGSAPTKSIDAVSFTASGGNNDMVELAGGYYDIEITAAQLNITAGRCGFLIYDDDVILPYFEEWLVVPANVFDSIMGTDKLDVNAAELGGTSQTGNDVGADVNDILADTGTDGVLLSAGTGAKQISLTSGAVLLQATQTGVTIPTVTTVTNAPTGMALEASLTAIKGGGWTDETLVTIQAAAEAATAPTAATVADAVWNEAIADHVTAGSTGKALTDVLEDTSTTLDTVVDAIKAKTDLITTGTTITIASPVSGSTITAQRGDTLSAALENIGSLLNHSKIYFTVKWDASDADSISLIQIEHTAGLTYINGAAAVTAANGTLTVDDEATGDVTIGLAAVEVAKLSPGQYSYDIQIVRSAGVPVSTLTSGTFIVASDITRAVT